MSEFKKYLILTLVGGGIGILLFLLPKAIKFFFRGLYLLMEYPLEGLGFFTFLTLFLSVGIYTEQKELKKD